MAPPESTPLEFVFQIADQFKESLSFWIRSLCGGVDIKEQGGLRSIQVLGIEAAIS
jgi:hypothetical protein